MKLKWKADSPYQCCDDLDSACAELAFWAKKCPRGAYDYCPNVVDGRSEDCNDQENRAAACWKAYIAYAR